MSWGLRDNRYPKLVMQYNDTTWPGILVEARNLGSQQTSQLDICSDIKWIIFLSLNTV